MATIHREFLASLLLVCAAVMAQNSASISGTVRDSSGAVIPNAEVTLTSVDRGVSQKTFSNSAGEFLLAGLNSGKYRISITSKGFKTFRAPDIVLEVAQKAHLDASLEVGDIAVEVAVQGSGVTQVETESAEVSGVVTTKEISQIVLNGRNFSQLVTLVPGVSNRTGQDEGKVGVAGNVSMSVNGGRIEDNNWELDGGDNMDNGSNQTLNVYPNVDAIAEVRVLTSNYGAQYGRNGSGTILTVTKSGTSAFHGDLFEFVRNDDFNARGFFQSSVPAYKKNDFGYVIGGPVYIPGHYNRNKDKTFFFFSEEWRKESVPGQTFSTQVPSLQEQQGNFADVCPAAGAAVNTDLFPDCPVNPKTGGYFPNHMVPIDPNAKAILTLLPQPNSGSGTNSYYIAAPSQPTNYREELVRIDHNFSERLRLFGRYIHDSWNTVNATPLWGNGASFPTVGTKFVGPGVSLVANLTANVSPTLLNEFMFSYTTDHIFLDATGPAARPSGLTMTGLYNNGFGGLLPAVSVAGGNNYLTNGFQLDTGYFPWNNANPTYTYKDQLSKIVGSHNMFTGFYFVAAQKNEFNSPYIQGILSFDPSSQYSSGNAFADLLLGEIANFQQTNNKIKYYNRYKILEPYFQDDWHVSKRLTVNLGVRLSMFGTYYEKYYQAYNFVPGVYKLANAPQLDVTGDVTGQEGAIIPGSGNPYTGLVQCGKGGSPRGCMTGHLWNWAPRVGFAFDPFGDGKTSIRGGYGIFYEHTNGNEGNTEGLEGSPPLVETATQFNIDGYTSIGGGSLLFPISPRAIPTKVRWPYVQQWNFGVQREVLRATVLTVAYVGSKGTNLGLQRDINQLYPISPSQNPYRPGQAMTKKDCSSGLVNGAAPTGQAAIQFSVACGGDPNPFRPFLGYGTITSQEYVGNSSYNSMQVSLKRHVGRLSFDLAYTWSHSLDDSSDYSDGNFLDSYNLRLARASSNFDQRHLLNFGYVYDLPFFAGQGMMHKVLGGWQWSGLTTYQTGTPFSVTNGRYGSGVGNGAGTGAFLDLVGDPNNVSAVNSNVTGVRGPLLYNPAAFTAAQGLTFGTAQRNVLNLPSRTNFDMGLFKHFAFTEARALEFRAEAFNVFNHTQWSSVRRSTTCFAGPTFSAGDPSCLNNNNFLRPTAAHNPRILQLGMKLIF